MGVSALIAATWLPVAAQPADEDAGSARDSTLSEPSQRRAPPPRRKNRKGFEIDPRVYEARGRELQGEFYEISGNAPTHNPSARPNQSLQEDNAGPEATAATASKGRRWMVWAGAASLVGAAGGAAGWYLMMDQPGDPKVKRVVVEISDN